VAADRLVFELVVRGARSVQLVIRRDLGAVGVVVSDSHELSIGDRYRSSRLRLESIVNGVGLEELRAPVAACPGWTVFDVVAHLVGVVEDAFAGRLDGPPSPLLTAAQVARHSGDTADELLERWRALAPAFEAAITTGVVVPAFLDVLSHEHDVRTALAIGGGRGDPDVTFAAGVLADGIDGPLRVELVDDTLAGPPPPTAHRWVLWATPFEVFRLRLGRRTRAQVRSMRWSADPVGLLDRLFVFGPATVAFESSP
jgi:hypothetical protein